MKELVEVVAKALVDNPDEVVVTEKTEGKNIVLELHVAASDKDVTLLTLLGHCIGDLLNYSE